MYLQITKQATLEAGGTKQLSESGMCWNLLYTGFYSSFLDANNGEEWRNFAKYHSNRFNT